MGKVLVTGAAGFIGSQVTEYMLARGDTVVGIDNLDPVYDPQLKLRHIELLRQHSGFEFIHADIRNIAEIESIFKVHKFCSIVHLAAKAGVRPSFLDPAAYIDTNVKGTSNLLQLSANSTVEHFVFASSSSVYGDRVGRPFAESDFTDRPVSPYAATKKMGEEFCYIYHHRSGIPVSCLRFFTAYGPRQRPDLAIHKFAHLLSRNLPIPVFGDGNTSRDYTYVGDIVNGVALALDKPAQFEIYNIGSGRPVKLSCMIDILGEVMKKVPKVEYHPQQDGDVTATFADISKSKRMLNYQPTIAFEDGIERFIEWFVQQNAVGAI